MINQLKQCVAADLRQRTRQQSYLITLLVMSLLAMLFFPSPESHYQTLVVNGYRGIYNSAWLGVCLALLNTLFLPIICFYLVKNTITFDRQSLTCELIAATPISKFNYLLAKFLVNLLILTSIVLAMLVTTMLMQLYFGESYLIQLWPLIWPQLVFVFPILCVISAIAILFESIVWLRGGFGNTLYFFIWIGSIVHSVEGSTGVGTLLKQLEADVLTKFPAEQTSSNIGITASEESVTTFVWEGIAMSSNHLLSMLPILAIAILSFGLAHIFFDRFKQATSSHNDQASTSLLTKLIDKTGKLGDKLLVSISQFSAMSRQWRLEVLLLIKGLSNYWYVGLVGLCIAQLFVSQTILTTVLIPASWLYCVLVLSPLGSQSKTHNTKELMSYCSFSSSKQTMSLFFAGCCLLFLSTFVGLARLVILSQWLIVAQVFIGIGFSVALALFCGTMTQTRRTFEVIYPAFWYIGPMQSALYVDYFGVNSQASWQANMPLYVLIVTIALLTTSLTKIKLTSH